MSSRPRISIFGLGRVGLCLAACYASEGFHVIGVDVDRRKLEIIKRGETPFYEPGLHELLKKSLNSHCLVLTSSASEAIANSDISFITVGTPSNPDGSASLSQVKTVCRQIGVALAKKGSWHLIVVKSTVPPGTTGGVIKELLERWSGQECGNDFGLCMNPEFLSEGAAIRGIKKPDRLVIGEYNRRSGDILQAFYELFYGSETCPPILRTSLVNAELIKYANNAFLAMKVSFINMIANLCQKLPGADVEEVARGIGLDRRIGSLFLRAGAGWGGSCWPKDLTALKTFAEKLGVEMPLIEATIRINEKQPLKLVDLAKQLLGQLEGKRVSVLGLSFKPGTDDMRGAVSIKVVNALLEAGAKVVVYDPKAMENAGAILGDRVEYAPSLENCLSGSDCAILVTEWDEFKKLEPETLKKLMRNPILIDGRRIFPPERFSKKIKFAAIGYGNA